MAEPLREFTRFICFTDTSVARHFGSTAEVSVRHIGSTAEVSGHFGSAAELSQDTSVVLKELRIYNTHCSAWAFGRNWKRKR